MCNSANGNIDRNGSAAATVKKSYYFFCAITMCTNHYATENILQNMTIELQRWHHKMCPQYGNETSSIIPQTLHTHTPHTHITVIIQHLLFISCPVFGAGCLPPAAALDINNSHSPQHPSADSAISCFSRATQHFTQN